MAVLTIDQLKQNVDDVITTNGNAEITGALLNQVCQDMIDTLLVSSNLPLVVSKSFSDWKPNASAEKSIDIGVVPAGYRLVSLIAVIDTPFSGGAISNVVMDIGTTADFNRYTQFAPASIITPANTIAVQYLDGKINDWVNDTQLKAKIVTTGGVVDDLTAGKIDFIIKMEQHKQ